MRAMLAIALAFVVGSFIAAPVASKGRNYPHFFKHRTKLREIRGFKPEYISTAIGFGKRDNRAEVPDFTGPEKDLLSVLSRVGVPADALFRMMQTNSALAAKLTQLSMQSDQGDQGESMAASLSRPGRAFALF